VNVGLRVWDDIGEKCEAGRGYEVRGEGVVLCGNREERRGEAAAAAAAEVN
jgi:hypothetical protein